MDKKPNFEMNRNLLQHFDDAVNDINASFKDSAEMDALKKLESRYTNKTYVAEGGMKEIHKCTDLYTERDIALAVPKKGSSADQINLFIREERLFIFNIQILYLFMNWDLKMKSLSSQ